MKFKRVHLLLLSTALMSGSAAARTPVLITPTDAQPGHFYVDINGDFANAPRSPLGYLETCVMKSGGDCSNDNTIAPFLVNDKHVNEFGGGATLGYQLSPYAGGGQPRIEFGFNWLTGKETASRSAILTGDAPFVAGSKNLLLIGIDGGSIQRCDSLADTPPGCGGNDVHKAFYNNDDYLDVDASIRTKQEEANFALRYLVDFDAGGNTKLTPFIAVIGGTQRTTFDAKGQWIDPSSLSIDGRDDTVLSSLFERVKTDYYGVEWGAQASYDLTERLTLFGGVQAALVHQSAKLRGHDCLSREYGGSDPGPVPAACTYNPADPVDEAGFATSASDKVSNWEPAFAFSAGVNVKVTHGISLAVTGFASYDTSYRVINPGGTSSDDSLPMAPAHLQDVQRWTPGAQITLSFAL